MVIIHKQEYFIPSGSLLRTLLRYNQCNAYNQAGNLIKRGRRKRFEQKAKKHITWLVKRQTGWDTCWFELTGSTSLTDVMGMRRQSYRMYKGG